MGSSDDIKAQVRAVPRLQGGACLACLLYFLCACCKSNHLKPHGTALTHVIATTCQPITIKSQIAQSLLPPSLAPSYPHTGRDSLECLLHAHHILELLQGGPPGGALKLGRRAVLLVQRLPALLAYAAQRQAFAVTGGEAGEGAGVGR